MSSYIQGTYAIAPFRMLTSRVWEHSAQKNISN